MATALTSKQKILLQIIRDYQRKYGTSPSLGELKNILGVTFVNSVVHLLDKLEEKKYITRAPGMERGIIPVENPDQTFKIPVVGAVSCGKPLLAEENVEGYINIDRSLVGGNPNNYFFLRAVGDSMNKANINGKNIDDGDYILIKQQTKANENDKVVALIDDEATIKVFKKGHDYVALVPQSTNPANKPIILHSDFSIRGIVRAVFKKEMLTA